MLYIILQSEQTKSAWNPGAGANEAAATRAVSWKEDKAHEFRAFQASDCRVSTGGSGFLGSGFRVKGSLYSIILTLHSRFYLCYMTVDTHAFTVASKNTSTQALVKKAN